MNEVMTLATQVADAMTRMPGGDGSKWTAFQREYRVDECAEIVNENGDAVWMTVMGRSTYARANERGKVNFHASSDYDMRDHYPYDAKWPETMVTEARGPEAMAKAVLSKVVPTLVKNNRTARERKEAFDGRRADGMAVATRLAAAVGETRPVRDDNPMSRKLTDRFEVGPYTAHAEVFGGERVTLTLRDVPVEMAERFLREVTAYHAENGR